MLGFRTSKELIRTGCESAYTEGVFFIDDPEVSSFLSEIGMEEEEDHSAEITAYPAAPEKTEDSGEEPVPPTGGGGDKGGSVVSLDSFRKKN